MRKILFQSVSPTPLALFRIAFGFVMTLQFIKFWRIFSLDFLHRSYFLKYDFFGWVQLPPENLLTLIFIVFVLSSLCFLLGILYRVASIIQFLGMAYCFLIEKSIYNNHYYLFILLAFLMIFTRADARFSIMGQNRESIGSGQILAIRLQLFILYFFGGVAKLNYDWLVSAQPVKMWLPDMLGSNYPLLSDGSINFLAYFIAYSGLAIDISVGFMLFSSRWKWVAMAILFVFHSTNMLMFNIGYFPLFGILSLVIFIEEKDLWKIMPKKLAMQTTQQFNIEAKPVFLYGFIGWFLLQGLIPLRHWILPGKVQWEMNAYLFSWHMKLNDYAPLLRFEVELPNSAERFTFEMDKLSESPMQRSYIATYPFLAVEFAKDIERFLARENNIKGDIKVYCDSYISLNGREFQRKINPNVDLTAIDLPPLGKFFTRQKWVIPLGNDTLVDKTVTYRLKKFEKSMQ